MELFEEGTINFHLIWKYPETNLQPVVEPDCKHLVTWP